MLKAHLQSMQQSSHCVKSSLHYGGSYAEWKFLCNSKATKPRGTWSNTLGGAGLQHACRELARTDWWAHLEAHGCIDSLHSVLEVEGDIRGQGDGYPVQQVLSEGTLLRVERGYQQRAAPV